MLSVGLVVCVLVFVVVVGYRLLEYRRLSPVREGISALKAGDYPLALSKLTPFAKAGDLLAQEMLGNMYAFGLGVPADERQARIWFRRAECEHGLPGRSEYAAALEYLEGFGTIAGGGSGIRMEELMEMQERLVSEGVPSNKVSVAS